MDITDSQTFSNILAFSCKKNPFDPIFDRIRKKYYTNEENHHVLAHCRSKTLADLIFKSVKDLKYWFEENENKFLDNKIHVYSIDDSYPYCSVDSSEAGCSIHDLLESIGYISRSRFNDKILCIENGHYNCGLDFKIQCSHALPQKPKNDSFKKILYFPPFIALNSQSSLYPDIENIDASFLCFSNRYMSMVYKKGKKIELSDKFLQYGNARVFCLKKDKKFTDDFTEEFYIVSFNAYNKGERVETILNEMGLSKKDNIKIFDHMNF